MRRIRCAVYTRKSTEEGLEQEFNSLDAQREACEAYIASQKHEGWELIGRAYDDGGISGGHMDRPALQRLMQDLDAKQVDQIVVYKIDRLTRSLSDFARLVDRLDAAQASFVSVTQSFNTGTSMGRLTLNVLLSFAQFEREVTAERIRDKIAASKRKGLWMGGSVPLGYDANGRTLRINKAEADSVTTIYDLYEIHGALNKVTDEVGQLGIRSRRRRSRSGEPRGGKVLSRGHIHHILSSPIYAGCIPHKGKIYEGRHPAIIEPARWQGVQDRLRAKSPVAGSQTSRDTSPSPLLRKLFDENGACLSPSHTTKRGKRYRYYISRGYVTGLKDNLEGKGWRLPAEKLEQMVMRAIRHHLSGAAGHGLVPDAQVHTLKRLKCLTDGAQHQLLEMLSRATLKEGLLCLILDAGVVADMIDINPSGLRTDLLSFDVPFIQRRRGGETRFAMSAPSAQADQTLIANIARAHDRLQRIKRGETLDEIATAENTTRKRVQQNLEYAFLAPDIVRDVLAGTQPIGLTSTYVATHTLPSDWAEQREIIAAL